MVGFYTDFYLRYLDAVMQPGVDVVLGGDDLGQKTGPLLRPELVEKLYGESYRRVADLVHRRGKKYVFHCCGNIYKFLDRFVDWGFDGLLTLEPTAGMDLARVREQVGHKLALVGNLDVTRAPMPPAGRGSLPPFIGRGLVSPRRVERARLA